MSELEDVSFWPGKSSYGSWGDGSSDGSYSRVGQANQPMVSCRRKTVLILVAVVALVFIIAVSIPAGMLQHIKSSASAEKAQAAETTAATTTGEPPLANSTTTSAAPQTTAKPSMQYRLPTKVMPSQYKLSISLGLTGKESGASHPVIPYNGTVVIELNVTVATKFIVLHSQNLTWSKTQVAEVIGGQLGAYANVNSEPSADETLQQRKITLGKKYPANTTLSLRIEFNSTLSGDLNGFYQSSYGAANSKILATTQFESVYARKAFPCFDEPSFKATFALNITRPKGWISLFNTQRLPAGDDSGDGPQTDVYPASPKMSTYLVAFIVCDFGHTTPININSKLTKKNITITVYGQKSQISQLTYAARIAGQILSNYEEFFNISYPLPKLDIVAIPDFAAGAMENWGLITFRESSLLYDSNKSSSSQKQYVTYVLAHELAHQWFGNYVTMKWWNELWLNEGFATFVGKLVGTENINSDGAWPVTEDFRADLAASLTTDSLLTSHPLSQNEGDVNSGHQIEAMFDGITYTKGSGVLNMLYEFVGHENMKLALQDYLSAHAYGNAEATDLWAAFDKQQVPGTNKKTISKMMKLWTRSAGHPVITTDCSKASISISQQPFFLCQTCNNTGRSSSKWIVPVQYSVLNNSGSFISGNMTLKDSTGTKPIGVNNVNFTVLNSGWNGYYHVHYKCDVHDYLHRLSDTDAGNIIQDALQLYRRGSLNPGDFYNLLKEAASLPKSQYLTWKMLLRGMWYLSDFYGPDITEFNQVAAVMYEWLDVDSMNLTYSAVNAWNVKQRTTLNSRLALALYLDHERASRDAVGLSDLKKLALNRLKNDSTGEPSMEIHPDIARQVMICSYLSEESLSLQQSVWKLYNQSHVPSEQVDYMVVMASGKDVLLLKRYLETALENTTQGNVPSIISLVAANKYGRDATWQFVKSNWDTLYKRYGNTGFAMARIIKATLSGFSNDYMLNEVKQFFSSREVGAGQRAYQQSLELIQTNIYATNNASRILLNKFVADTPPSPTTPAPTTATPTTTTTTTTTTPTTTTPTTTTTTPTTTTTTPTTTTPSPTTK